MLEFFKPNPVLPKNKEELEKYLWLYPVPFSLFIPDDYQRICNKIISVYVEHMKHFDFAEYEIPTNQTCISDVKRVCFRLKSKSGRREIFFTVIWNRGTINLKSLTLIHFRRI